MSDDFTQADYAFTDFLARAAVAHATHDGRAALEAERLPPRLSPVERAWQPLTAPAPRAIPVERAPLPRFDVDDLTERMSDFAMDLLTRHEKEAA